MTRVWFSNRYEVLADRVVEALGGPRASIFEAEQVIVPSAALQRDLSLRIARRHGVCAQVEFSFLAQWLWRQIARRVPQVAQDTPFAPAVLAWRIDRLLAEPALAQAHPRLASYLGSADAVMRFTFAGRLAGLVDQLVTYRPDWLAAWAEGRSAAPPGAPVTATWRADEAWQAALWRRLLAELGLAGAHPAQRFLEALADTPGPADAGGAVHLVGLPTIPPLYLQVLRELGRHADLRLYLLNPCREYWFDLVDRKRLSHLAARGLADHVEVGNPLLGGWGAQTQAQIDLLLDGDGADALQDSAEFVEAAGHHLLARLQNAVLDGEPLPAHGLPHAAGDRSIELHVAHSLTRELEVLHDRLLGLFAQGADLPGGALRPEEVLVVTPDLEAAAPLVDAVFGTAPPERHIPFTVTGRPRRAVNRCARALRELLTLLQADGPASAVFDLLQQPVVARRAGLDAAGLAWVHGWFADAGFRRGLGGGGAPSRHDLDAALQRLFLAHALPVRVDTPFAGELPAGTVEGSEALALGALWRLAERLRGWQAAFARAHPPAGWHALLLATLDELLLPEQDEAEELRELQSTLHTLAAQMAEGGVTGPVEPAVLRRALDELLDEPARGGVPTGRVTIAAMSSLRGLPFRVVCAVGLNDGAFPSTSRALEFDLMAQRPRRGDRQRRHDDRNVFLDLLLSARQVLHLSHTGRSVRDNTPLPPSVLVSELLDLLLPAIAAPPGDAAALAEARARLVVEHPLQAFSPRAFSLVGDARLRSHRREEALALQASLATPAPVAAHAAVLRDAGDGDEDDDPVADVSDADDLLPPEPSLAFFDAPLTGPDAAWRTPDIETLVRFFQHPCRTLLQERLGLVLPRQEEALDDDEPFVPGWPGQNELVARVLTPALAGASPAQLQALAAAGVQQPDGSLGVVWRTLELQGLARHAERLRAELAVPVLPPVHGRWSFDLDGEEWVLSASFTTLRPGGLLHHRYQEARVWLHLEVWLWHLALCAAAPPGVAPVSRLHARDGLFTYAPCDDARTQLAALLRLYRHGLREPLHFYPKTAWAWIDKGSMSAARSAWTVTRQYPRGEAGDPAHRLALRGIAQPLDAAFEACATQVLGPLKAHLSSEPLASGAPA